MTIDVYGEDLRLLSLFHALGDKEELIREAVRLLQESKISDATWNRIRCLGIEFAPKHPLFTSNKTVEQLRNEFAEYPREGHRITFDRRQTERRGAERRVVSDRRLTALTWLGQERRDTNRRQSTRRQT